jgi:hypothetical protein
MVRLWLGFRETGAVQHSNKVGEINWIGHTIYCCINNSASRFRFYQENSLNSKIVFLKHPSRSKLIRGRARRTHIGEEAKVQGGANARQQEPARLQLQLQIP